MSISRTKTIPQKTKDTFYSKKHFRRMVDGTVKKIRTDDINFALAVAVILTGVGEIIGSDLSNKWYALIASLLIFRGIRGYFKLLYHPVEIVKAEENQTKK